LVTFEAAVPLQSPEDGLWHQSVQGGAMSTIDDSPSVHHAHELGHRDAGLLQLVTFNIAEEEFGVDILSVQ
jgi:hypothetical protein